MAINSKKNKPLRVYIVTRDKDRFLLEAIRVILKCADVEYLHPTPESFRGLHFDGPMKIVINSRNGMTGELVDAANCCCTGINQGVVVV